MLLQAKGSLARMAATSHRAVVKNCCAARIANTIECNGVLVSEMIIIVASNDDIDAAVVFISIQ